MLSQIQFSNSHDVIARSEATLRGEMDCFASLAMTIFKHA